MYNISSREYFIQSKFTLFHSNIIESEYLLALQIDAKYVNYYKREKLPPIPLLRALLKIVRRCKGLPRDT